MEYVKEYIEIDNRKLCKSMSKPRRSNYFGEINLKPTAR